MDILFTIQIGLSCVSLIFACKAIYHANKAIEFADKAEAFGAEAKRLRALIMQKDLRAALETEEGRRAFDRARP